MSKWKEAFFRSIDRKHETEDSFEFGPPATDAELAALESEISATIPPDLREMLSEFNGVYEVKNGRRELYFEPTKYMAHAAEYYRDWDWPTEMLLDCSKNILYVCEENGSSAMWGVVVKPFASFHVGQIVAFDHDRIAFSETPEELFIVPYESLMELVEAKHKDAWKDN
jgi:hypothetical protein